MIYLLSSDVSSSPTMFRSRFNYANAVNKKKKHSQEEDHEPKRIHTDEDEKK